MSGRNFFSESFQKGPEKKEQPKLDFPSVKTPNFKQPNFAGRDRNTSHETKNVFRDDVNPAAYAQKRIPVGLSIYNMEVKKFLSEFSQTNQANGGIPITKSELIETILDVFVYDMQIAPEGYRSVEQLREDIQAHILSKGD